ELDQVRVLRSHLRGLVNEWLATGGASLAASPAPSHDAVETERRLTFNPHAVAEVSECIALQDAHLLASKALRLRGHARLERGLSSEAEIPLLRVLLQNNSITLEEFESYLRLQFALAAQRDDHPIVEPSAGPAVRAYAEYLAKPNLYDSGDFLHKPVD